VAIGDPYVTGEDLAARLNKPNDGFFDDIVSAASRAVELFTGRQFNRDETASARRFRSVDWCRLTVDDFWTTTDLAISVDGTAWLVTDVDPRPWDGVHNGQPGWPFFDLFTVDRSWPYATRGRRSLVTVTAKWGWEAVPEPIKQATLDVAQDVYGGISVDVTTEQIGGVAVTARSLRTESMNLTGLVSGNPAAFLRAIPYVRDSPMGIA
jgi:hypothetical protein